VCVCVVCVMCVCVCVFLGLAGRSVGLTVDLSVCWLECLPPTEHKSTEFPNNRTLL